MLDRFLAALTGPRALIVEGEAGIGKTSLWKGGLALARARGYRTLSCRAAGTEVRLSFAALGDLLAGVVDQTLPVLPGPLRRALEAALLLADGAGEVPDQRSIGLAVLNVLGDLSREGPLLIAIDDAQWLDSPSIAVLGFALRRVHEELVGVLATVRLEDAEPRTQPPFEAWLTAERLRLGPLSLGAIHELLRTRRGASFSRPTLVRLHEEAAGNPFFALELGRALGELGHEPSLDEPLPVPAGLRALIAARLARLPAPARQTLCVVATASRPTVALAEAVAGDSERAMADLESGVGAGVITRDGERICFTHPLLSSTLYAQAPLSQRRRLHRRLAEVVTDSEERARHLALAADGPEAAVASALDEAAAKAHLRGAPDAAASLAEQARALTPQDRPADLRRRGLDAASYHTLAGDTSRARIILEEMLSDAPATARARLLHGLGEIHGREDSWATAADFFTQALNEVEDDASLRCEIEQGLAFARQVTGDMPEAAAHARAALELAEQSAAPGLLSSSLAHLALFEFFLGHGIRYDLMDRAATLEQETGPIPQARPAHVLSRGLVLAAMLKWTDQFEAARSAFETLRRHALEHGDEASLAFLLSNMSELECWAGNLALAERYAAEGLRISALTEQGTMLAANLYAKALVDAHLGNADAARSAAEESLARAQASANASVALMSLSALGFLELSLGDPANAHARLGPLVQGAAAVGLAEPGVLRFVPDEVEALVALGALEEATALVDAVQERATTLDRPWALATGARSRALLLAAQGDLTAAEVALERALDAHHRLPQPFERARTLLVLGTVQRRQHHKRYARQTLDQALEIFERLDARLWADKARGELRRIGGRPASRGALSETEAQIAALVAAGHTNQEVAQALSLSTKTVAWNLSKVYRKLGVRSRTELARQTSAQAHRE